MAATVMARANLYFKNTHEGGTSDKVYYVWIESAGIGDKYYVRYSHGRRTGTLRQRLKTESGPVGISEAEKIYNKILVDQLAQGYNHIPPTGVLPDGTEASAPALGDPAPVAGPPMAGGEDSPVVITPPPKVTVTVHDLRKPPAPMLPTPINAEGVLLRIGDPMWYLERKHDGWHVFIEKVGEKITGWTKTLKPMDLPPEYCSVLQTHFPWDFILDGEACGNIFWAFDILQLEGQECISMPYEERKLNLGMLFRSVGKQSTIRQVYTAETREEKIDYWSKLQRWGIQGKAEGAVLKDIRCPYVSGKGPIGQRIVKFKFLGEITCMVLELNKERSVRIGVPKTHTSDSMPSLSSCVPIGNVSIPVNATVPSLGDLIDVTYRHANRGSNVLQETVYKCKRTDAEIGSLEDLKYKEEE